MSDPFIILSLSGGGYCGLYTASILERVEEARGGVPLCESVDLVTGTSVGGIIALGLAHGIPAKRIREEIETGGPTIFRDQGNRVTRIANNSLGTLRGLLGTKYKGDKLYNVIKEVVPDKPISQAKMPVAVAAVCSNGARPKVFRNYWDEDVGTYDAAMATSAAPTYFPPHKVGNDFFLDGGIVANNPDLIGFMEAVGKFAVEPKDIVIVSVGATNLNLVRGAKKPRFSGVLPQFLSIRRSIAFTLEVQQELSRQLTEEAIPTRYLRVTTRPGKDAERFAQLDRADQHATQTLLSLAEAEFQAVKHQGLMRLIQNRARKKRTRWENGKILSMF